jgi:hypothetical protein
MIRAAILALLLAQLPLPGAAQDEAAAPTPDDPTLQIEFEQTETIPGQPLSLRMTVLVPTYMPKPPVWPSLEAPNLLVRLPEGSTTPTSTRIGGQTWSGISRRYRISPMVPGAFVIPPQQVIVTYADPDTNEPVQATLVTEALAFSGVIPESAEGVDPFIAANGLTLTQEIDGDPAAMVPGDSVTRTLTASIEGTSPMFLPGLLPATRIGGVAAYADEPVMDETDNRGALSGSRTERVTFVAEGGGSGEAAPVSIDWYNLDTGAVETTSVEGLSITVDGPPARASGPRDWRVIGLAVLVAVLATAAAWWALRRIVPIMRRRGAARRAAWLASERHGYSLLRHVVARRDHADLRPALDAWASRVSGPDPRGDPRLRSATTELGAARYGPYPDCDAAAAWADLAAALPEVRRTGRDPARTALLPPLNPA